MTQWKAIDGFPRYEISDDGRVRVITTARGQGVAAGRLLTKTGKFDTKGYPIILLRDGTGKTYTKKVHRLVALAFLGPPTGPQVNHKDGVKSNCRATNLEWASARENVRHAIRLGLYDPHWRRGSDRMAKKLTAEMARAIRAVVAAGQPRKIVALRYGIHEMTVGEIIRREIWPDA